jgi:hypothetical protein
VFWTHVSLLTRLGRARNVQRDPSAGDISFRNSNWTSLEPLRDHQTIESQR